MVPYALGAQPVHVALMIQQNTQWRLCIHIHAFMFTFLKQFHGYKDKNHRQSQLMEILGHNENYSSKMVHFWKFIIYNYFLTVNIVLFQAHYSCGQGK